MARKGEKFVSMSLRQLNTAVNNVENEKGKAAFSFAMESSIAEEQREDVGETRDKFVALALNGQKTIVTERGEEPIGDAISRLTGMMKTLSRRQHDAARKAHEHSEMFNSALDIALGKIHGRRQHNPVRR